MNQDANRAVAAAGYPTLPGVPAGTCTPTQLQGVHVRKAIHAHCCSGVNGPGPAHGTSGPPHGGGGSACAGAEPTRTPAAAAATNNMTALKRLTWASYPHRGHACLVIFLSSRGEDCNPYERRSYAAGTERAPTSAKPHPFA
jgi:hypothetical protein